MGFRSFKLVTVCILLLLGSLGWSADKPGYRVTIHKVIPSKEHRNKNPAIKVMTALTVSPLPPGQYEIEGVDLRRLGERAKSPFVLRKIAENYLRIIESEYLASLDNEAFAAHLKKAEPFVDGRTSAIAIFEGEEFTNARMTFRVSYALSPEQGLPFINTTGGRPSDYYENQPLSLITPDNLPGDLGRGTAQVFVRFMIREAVARYPKARLEDLFVEIAQTLYRMHPGMFGPDGKPLPKYADFITREHGLLVQRMQARLQEDPLKVFAMKANSQKASQAGDSGEVGGVEINNEHTANSAQEEFYEYARTHAVQMGGPPLEIKGLSHKLGTNHAEFLFAGFIQAVYAGLFDLAPARLGLPVPTTIVGATAADKLEKVFPQVGAKTLKEVDVPGLGAAVIFQLTRGQLSEWIGEYSVRTLLELADETYPKYQAKLRTLTDKQIMDRAAVMNTEVVKGFMYPLIIPENLDFVGGGCRSAVSSPPKNK